MNEAEPTPEQEANKQKVYIQVKQFHKVNNDLIMEHRLEYCPLAVVSALTMLLYDLTKALSEPEKEKIMYICHDLYPELALLVTTGDGPNGTH